MTQIDFYILAAQSQQERLEFSCRLAERAWNAGHRVFIQVSDEKQAKQLDEMLWHNKPESFIPHGLITDSPDAPVGIGYGDDSGNHHEVLINLSAEVPGFFSRYARLLEVVIQDDEVLETTRQHYRFYKERGYPLKNTDMRMAGAQ